MLFFEIEVLFTLLKEWYQVMDTLKFGHVTILSLLKHAFDISHFNNFNIDEN